MRWRSVLFVPGDRPELARKVPRFAPDVLVIDLEDAVPPERKPDARVQAADVARELAGDPAVELAVCVRVNAMGSPWFDDDVAAVPPEVAAIVVPKWEAPLDLGRPVVAGIETVRGVAEARALLGAPVVACYFGAEDFVTDLGGVRTRDNREVLYARSAVSVAARLAGVVALDMVTVEFTDSARFAEEAAEARALGYAGKICVHPAQIELANAAFVPSAAEVARAERLLAAFAAAGGETIAFEGIMVDEVVAAQARAVLAHADASG